MTDMEYSKIISVTGFGGLFELLSSKSDGAIVRSLDDKTTRFVSSRQHNFSHLESIEIFTVRDNVNLADVFLEMQKNSTPLPDTKDNAAVKKYFEAVYPDIDFERVYTSDMKKMVKWLEILSANNIEIKAPEAGEEAESAPAVAEEVPEAIAAEEKPKKAAKKKAEPAAEKAAAKAEDKKSEDTPKKKAAAKKTATTKDEAPKKKAAKKKTDSK
jgi:type II secretory pathway component GspD/PulD (secretin)